MLLGKCLGMNLIKQWMSPPIRMLKMFEFNQTMDEFNQTYEQMEIPVGIIARACLLKCFCYLIIYTTYLCFRGVSDMTPGCIRL